MKQLTKKQFLKRKTIHVACEINKALLPADTEITVEQVLSKFPERSYYKDSSSGEIRVGLSLKGIRKLIKKYPLITTEQIMGIFNVKPLV